MELFNGIENYYWFSFQDYTFYMYRLVRLGKRKKRMANVNHFY